VISSELKRTVGAEKKRSEEEEEGRKEREREKIFSMPY